MLIEVGEGPDNLVGAEHIRVLREHFEAAVAASEPVAFVAASPGRMFCAGFDLADLLGRPEVEARQAFAEMLRLVRGVFHAPVPVAVLAGGHAVGVGAMLVLAADRAVMTPRAKLRFPEASIGLGLFGDTVELLHYRGGPMAAERLLRYGRPLPASEAASLGLVDAVAEELPAAEALLDEAQGGVPAHAFVEMKRLCRDRFLREPAGPQLDAFMRMWSLPDTQRRMGELFPG